MAKACSTKSRLTRGTIGGGVGLVVGGAVGFGVAWWLANRAIKDVMAGAEASVTPIWVARLGTPLVAAVAGATVGAWQPAC